MIMARIKKQNHNFLTLCCNKANNNAINPVGKIAKKTV